MKNLMVALLLAAFSLVAAARSLVALADEGVDSFDKAAGESMETLECGVCYDLGYEYVWFSGAYWLSARMCKDGTPFCWAQRFLVGDCLLWEADAQFNQLNNGLYCVEDVFFVPEWRRYVIVMDHPVLVSDIGASGTLTSTAIHRDGFESGDFSAWSVVVGSKQGISR